MSWMLEEVSMKWLVTKLLNWHDACAQCSLFGLELQSDEVSLDLVQETQLKLRRNTQPSCAM